MMGRGTSTPTIVSCVNTKPKLYTEQLVIRVQAAELARWKALAESYGCPVSMLVRNVMARHLQVAGVE